MGGNSFKYVVQGMVTWVVIPLNRSVKNFTFTLDQCFPTPHISIKKSHAHLHVLINKN